MINRQVVTQGDFLRLDRTHWMMRGLQGWWPLQEGAGETAFDISGKGRHGTLTNMAPDSDWVVGQRGGYSLDFPGTTERYIAIPDYVEDAGGTGYTFCCWFNKDDGVTHGLFGNSDNNNKRHLVFIRSTGTIDGIFGDGGAQYNVSNDGSTLSNGVWHHVALALDFKGTCVRYLDGVQTGTVDSMAGLDFIDTPNFGEALGARKRSSTTTDVESNGRMFDARHWNRKLSASEIREVYLNPWAPLSTKSKTFLTVSAPSAPGIIYNQRQILIKNQKLILK